MGNTEYLNFLICYFVDVVSIPKTNENFRLLYDTKGRFRLHSIKDEEAKVCTCHFDSFLVEIHSLVFLKGSIFCYS